MNILVVGDEQRATECKNRFGPSHHYVVAPNHSAAMPLLGGDGIVFDFMIHEHPHQIRIYADTTRTVFLNTACANLSNLVHAAGTPLKVLFFGFNGLPTFLSCPALEVALFRSSDRAQLQALADTLDFGFHVVEDRVGLVTPRVVSMIINEAYFTAEEKTATREDVDLAMKLGTNYPYGPFEWCERIGIRHIYQLLEALHAETKDDRYRVCPLLKAEYQKLAPVS